MPDWTFVTPAYLNVCDITVLNHMLFCNITMGFRTAVSQEKIGSVEAVSPFINYLDNEVFKEPIHYLWETTTSLSKLTLKNTVFSVCCTLLVVNHFVVSLMFFKYIMVSSSFRQQQNNEETIVVAWLFVLTENNRHFGHSNIERHGDTMFAIVQPSMTCHNF